MSGGRLALAVINVKTFFKMSKGIFMLVAMTFAFIIPYLLSFTYITFNSIAKPTISYQTDFIIRNTGGVLVTALSTL